MATHNVTFQRPDYKGSVSRWTLADDCCTGQEAIKAKSHRYLPKPNATDASLANQERYKKYLLRAVFYNVTGRTLQGLTGMVFRKWPVADLPAALQYAETDVDGAGISVYQQSQKTLEGVLKRGRHALLVDYPQTEGQVSKAQMSNSGIRASVAAYDSGSVINWRTDKIGGIHKLVLVVLREFVEEEAPDGFGSESIEQYRVLRLIGGVYTVEVWREIDENWVLFEEPYSPADGAGNTWDTIPFTFVGSQNNDASVDEAPLYDLAELNIAHYRNSADYEEGVYMHGQGTLVLDVGEISQEEFDRANPGGVRLGAVGGIIVGKGGKGTLLQMEANTPALEAMKHKEDQMIALGAQLIIKGGQARTATEADNDSAMNSSVLSMCASNVSEAYTQCLQWMARFMGAPDNATYQLNQDFVEQSLDAQTLQAYMQLVQFGSMPDSDLWTILRKHGVINAEKSDEEIREELETSSEELGLENAE